MVAVTYNVATRFPPEATLSAPAPAGAAQELVRPLVRRGRSRRAWQQAEREIDRRVHLLA